MSIERLRPTPESLPLTSNQQQLLKESLVPVSENAEGEFARRQAIREFCVASRALAQRPEQLLIVFKESLIEAANEANIPPGPERSALLGRVVSVFIEELYGFRTGNRVSGDWSNEGRI
jgi:hypothetical protein